MILEWIILPTQPCFRVLQTQLQILELKVKYASYLGIFEEVIEQDIIKL